jgi:hypothetical protein
MMERILDGPPPQIPDRAGTRGRTAATMNTTVFHAGVSHLIKAPLQVKESSGPWLEGCSGPGESGCSATYRGHLPLVDVLILSWEAAPAAPAGTLEEVSCRLSRTA